MTNQTDGTYQVNISATRFYSASGCSQAYSYQYKQGLRKKQAETPRIELGRIVHSLIARVWQTIYQSGNYFDLEGRKRHKQEFSLDFSNIGQDYFEENKSYYAPDSEYTLMLMGMDVDYSSQQPLEEFKQNVEDAIAVVQHLFETYLLQHYIPVVDDTVLIEYELRYSSPTHQFVGFVDAVLYDKRDKTINLIDWKTRDRLETSVSNILNPQLDLYAYYLQALVKNVAIDNVIEYQVRSKAPEKPSINKDGTVSKRKIVTTFALYRQAILDAGGSVSDYQEQFETWVGQDWVNVIVKPTNKAIQMRHLNNVADTIVKADTMPPTRSTGWSCKMCQFAPLCEAHFLGYNEQDVIDELYESKY